MKNNSTVLRSKFARRLVALLVLAALIPIAVMAILSLSPGHEASLGSLRKVFVPVTVVALLAVALLSIRAVRRMLGPLEKLIDGTRRAGNQDFSARLGDDELGELATSFNSMASRLGSQFSALVTLADIDDAILSRHELDRVVDTAVLRMGDIVPADFVSIAMIDRSAPEMMRVSTRDQCNDGPLAHVCTTHAADDIASLAAHHNGMWVGRAQAFAPHLAPVAGLGAASMLVLPIVSQNAVVGAVVLGFKGEQALTDEERARARLLGDRVAVAFATATKDEQLYYQANYDAPTALPNRLYFKDQLARRLAQAQREHQPFALLFIDLDRFKTVNDALGHSAGDEVLRQAAERLKQCVRETDTVTRLGGDEFTIILSQIRSERDPSRLRLMSSTRWRPRTRSAYRAPDERQHRYRGISGGRNDRRRAAAQRRHRDVPGEGERPRLLRVLRGANECRRARARERRARIAPCRRARRIQPFVSADARHAQWPHLRRGGRAALGTARPRAAVACGFLPNR
jgi:diguanylate cyclase (GGDEF)-like protein